MPERPPDTSAPSAADDERARLLGDLLHRLRRQSEESIRFSAVFGEAHGMHQTDLGALAAIAEASRAGAPIGPAALAEAIHLSRPATTALVDRLERAGHLVRRADPRDGRRTVLEMQPQALELATAFFGPLGAAYAEVAEGFSPRELEVVSTFLDRIIEATDATRRRLAPDQP